MNTPTTLELRTGLQSNNKTYRSAAPLRIFARSKAKFRTSKASSAKAPDYRLGEVVQHGHFGTGRVMALWPTGSLLVRFDGADKNRLVFPSLLN